MKVKDRKLTEEKYKWKLEDIFESVEDWEKTYEQSAEQWKGISAYEGKLSDEKAALECLSLQSRLSLQLERLYVYANMRRDEDSSKGTYQAMCDRAVTLSVNASTLTSFIAPELSALPEERLRAMAANPDFADYSRMLEELIRDKEHILSEKEEKLLSGVSAFSGMFKNIFNMFDNADVRFKPIEDENGNTMDITHGLYSVALQDRSQEVRRRAFESMFGEYKAHINTLAQVYAGNVKKDWYFAKTRGFGSCLERSMFGEEVPDCVYKNLIETVGEYLPTMHKYVALRKKLLGLNTLNMYDLYVPVVDGSNIKYSYEKAFETVKNALKPMGCEYGKLLDRAFSERWIDVCENKGKRSGAYSWGAYGTHPYVLLNYQPTTHDVFTIAHELGHAMHSYMSDDAQCYEKAGYVIFVAEIASTVNEVLLLKYLMKTADGKLKKYLLSYYLDMFRTTVFRQTMFAEFEYAAHSMEEKGIPLTAESLSDKYLELNKRYYGKSVKHNDLIRYEWARIPHFYTAFYVYKYATGLTAAVTIANDILKRGESAYADYKRFLSAGGSMPPIEILKLAGVDLTTKEPFKVAMREFRDTLAELARA